MLASLIPEMLERRRAPIQNGASRVRSWRIALRLGRLLLGLLEQFGAPFEFLG
jgi:hypothetical protein